MSKTNKRTGHHTCTLLSNFKYKDCVYFEPGPPFNPLKPAVVKSARLEARGRRRCPNLNIASGWDYLSSRSLPFSLHYRLANGSNRNQAFGPGAYTWPQLTDDKRCSISFCWPPTHPLTLYPLAPTPFPKARKTRNTEMSVKSHPLPMWHRKQMKYIEETLFETARPRPATGYCSSILIYRNTLTLRTRRPHTLIRAIKHIKEFGYILGLGLCDTSRHKSNLSIQRERLGVPLCSCLDHGPARRKETSCGIIRWENPRVLCFVQQRLILNAFPVLVVSVPKLRLQSITG